MDPLADLKSKMAEYIENGVRLGWLFDLASKKVWIYRPNVEPLELDAPEELDGGEVLLGFILKLALLWV